MLIPQGDPGSSQKNQFRFVRVCINTDFPRPQGYVHILGSDNKTIFTFQIWYEGFSPGCGSCGKPDHLFQNCFLHNLQHEAQQLAPTVQSGEADNARQTKQLLARHYMSSQTPKSGPNRRPNIIGSSVLTASQKQQKAFQGRGLPPPSSVPMIQGVAAVPEGDSKALIPASSVAPSSLDAEPAAQDLLLKMRQMAILMETPHFKSLMNANGSSATPSATPKEGTKISPKRKEEKVADALLELAANGEEVPEDPKGKGKAIAMVSPKARSKRQRKNNGSALSIPGCEED